MNDTMQNSPEQIALATKLPWTDPEFAAAAIVDHTQGGNRAIRAFEDAVYRTS